MSGSYATLTAFIIIGVVLLAIAVWLLMRLNATTTIVDATEKRDVLDEGAAPAKRNQALIDAAPAAVANNFGETSAAANTDALAAAPASADAEAGASVDPIATPTQASTAQPTPEKSVPAVPKVVTDGEIKDDLSRIKGVGPKLVTMLGELGVTSFAQIAAWTDSDIEKIDAGLGRFKGRITRDQWVEQAKLLKTGDKSAYQAKFGNNA